MPTIPLQLLDNDPKSSNVCSPETLEKLRRNIERTGLYPPLIVRPRNKKSERFIIIDGHHRKLVLESMGHTEAKCVVWRISGQEAKIALATLNTLRGTENLKKRAELVQALTQTLPIEELAQLIPEATEEIQDLLALLEQDIEALERSVQEQMEAEKASLPVPLTFLVPPQDLASVTQALTHFQESSSKKPDRGVAFVNLCTFALKKVESQHAKGKGK